MKQAEKILSRLPHFYLGWDKRALISRLIHSIAMSLHLQQTYLFRVQKSHWVDTAYGADLDKIGQIFNLKRGGGESDDSFRERIKFALVNFRGGGTREAIITQLLHHFKLREDEFELIENPERPQIQEVIVGNGSKWKMRNRGVIEEEEAEVIMKLEPTGLGGVANPKFSNLSRQEETFQYQGMFKPGQTLVFKRGKAELDGTDVTERIAPARPISVSIPRKTTDWQYQESTSPKIGYFDSATFDEGFVFYRDVPTVRITFSWKAHMAATFEIKLRKGALERSGFTIDNVIKLVNAIKAAGVKADVGYGRG